MPGNDYLPDRESQLVSWLNNFAKVCDDNAPALNISAQQAAAIGTASDAFGTKYDASEAAKTAAKSAVTAKDTTKKSTVALVRQYAKQFKANPDISPELITALGINNPPSGTGIYTITNLVASPLANGVNKLKWNRNGNPPNTIFVVEQQFPGDTVWTQVSSQTSAKFDHTGQTPGQTCSYRVISKRGTLVSPPSTSVTVYGNSGNGSLEIAA